MGAQPPYRMPCGSVAGKPLYFFGNPAAHAVAPILVDNNVNITLVDNPADGGATKIPPYERWHCNVAGGCDGDINFCGKTADDCAPDPTQAPCAPFPRPFPANLFQKQGQTNFAVNHKKGFKAIQARRYWNGTFGKTRGGPDNVVGCPAQGKVVQWLSYQKVPRRSKYQQITVQASHSLDWLDTTGGSPVQRTATSTCSYVQTLDSRSGVFTIGDWVFNPNQLDSGAIEQPQNSNQAIYQTSFAYWTLQDAVSRFTNPLTPGATTFTSNGITVENFGQLQEDITWNIDINGTSSFDRKLYLYTNLGTQLMIRHETCSISDTNITYTDLQNNYGCFIEPVPPPFVTQTTVTGTLANVVKDSDIYNDVCGTGGLLEQWDLEDDEEHPWRKDTFVGVAPLVTRDEIQFSSWAQAPSFVVRDFSVHWPNGVYSSVPGADIGSPDWDGITGAVNPPTDPNSGVTAIAVPITSPMDLDGQSAGNPFSWTNPTYGAAGGALPTGISFHPDTGKFSGSSSDAGNFGVTIPVTGVAAADGSIVGAPLPAGYGGNGTGYFQFGWQDWRGCCCVETCDSAQWSWYQLGWGMSTTAFNNMVGCQIPLNATNWTNWWESINKPQGAWLFYNDQTQIAMPGDCDGTSVGSFNADALWACKYAEIVDIWPSQNFARPSGADKFSYDETQPVYAATIVSPGSVSLVDANGNVPPDGTTFAGIWGGRAVGGFYSGVSHSVSGIVTLGTRVFNCPSNWQSAAGIQSGGRPGSDDSGICFGQLRFPNVPSLPGRVVITPDNTGTIFTFAPAQPTFGMTLAGTETVDLWDKNMNLIAPSITATRVDDSHFTTTAACSTAAYVTITGAAKWYMNDSDGKGDFALLEWSSDTRSQGELTRLSALSDCSGNPIPGPSTNVGGGPIGNEFAWFSQQQQCVRFTPCGPKIICISPNGEFRTSNVFPPMIPDGQLPAGNNQFYFDEDYGTKWWGWFQVTMTDLLWQAPHTPLGIIPMGNPNNYSLTWAEDTLFTGCPGDCQPGNPPCGEFQYQHWYRHEPQVEARLSVPCNYGQNQNECGPDLPNGITIGWLSPVLYSGNDVPLPPTPPGSGEDSRPGTKVTAWNIHASICAEIAVNCSLNYVLSGC